LSVACGSQPAVVPQVKRAPGSEIVHILNTRALVSFWLHLDRNKCRDAAKIDHDQWPRLNNSAVSATVVNVGCIPGAGSPAL